MSHKPLISMTFISEAKHCPASSDCRTLITNPLPACQRESIIKYFDENFITNVPKCVCCYSCIQFHSNDGCRKCLDFLSFYFPQKTTSKVNKSVRGKLSEAVHALFVALNTQLVILDGNMEVTTASFVKDFITNIDEVRNETDIINIWQVEKKISKKLFSLLVDFFKNLEPHESDETNSSEDSEESSNCSSDIESSETSDDD